ncbi:MAG: plasma-membrane proton-efflux P-type ATPase [Thermofilum sp.]
MREKYPRKIFYRTYARIYTKVFRILVPHVPETPLRSTSEFGRLPVDEVLRVLGTSAEGLSEAEARARLEKYGYNEVMEERRSPVADFLKRYWGPMPWLLELAIVLSVLIGHYLEAAIIFVLLTVNAAVGFVHSHRSQKALEYLKKRLAVKAKVLRDGKWTVKDARELVPGDIIRVELGDLVPADAKILSGEVSVDQSALTGESLPVDLGPSDILYSSSLVVRGRADCVVISTGANTYFGRTAELVKKARPKSHQEEIVLSITRYMMYVAVAALALASVYALALGMSTLSILTLAVIFLMGAIPVALPAVFTIVQAVGALKLAKEGVLVTHLSAIEDAASVDVICLDKTGTITQNKLSVAEVVPFSRYTREDVVLAASLASEEESGSMIDMAVVSYARSMSLKLERYKRVSYTPFNPAIKRSEAIVEAEGELFKVVMGAPQVVLDLCECPIETRREVEEKLEELSRRGYRSLAVAKSERGDLNKLSIVGLIALTDPVRPDSRAMIEELKALGIKPMMLTGDNIHIAKEVASQVSIGSRIAPISVLRALRDEEAAKAIEEYDGFAEVYPEDKYRIVKLLQMNKHMVGMTGDGVNDAPALRQAEMGIAVSNATDVAKASASVVLTEEGLRVIVNAVKVSRQIYQRMLTWVINKISKTIEFIALLTVGFFWLRDVVLSLLGMTLLIFANDFVTMSLATDNVKHTSNPNKWNVKNITLASLAVGLLYAAESIAAMAVGRTYFHLGPEKLRTFMLLVLVYNSQFRVYSVRERKHFWSSRPGRELTLSTTAAVVGFTLLALHGAVIPPLPLEQVLFPLGLSAAFTFGIVDPLKYLTAKRLQL